jgi:Chaperone of endosialidase
MKTRIPTFLVIFSLATFVSLPEGTAVSPPPDGGYPGFNTAEGQNALFSLSTGVGNTAVGWFSLFSNGDGSFNTAVGAGTLLFNVGDQSSGAGISNTAVGTAALLFNTTGADNTAVGTAALLNNTTGVVNTALGSDALRQNTDGNFNTAVGRSALSANTSGQENTAVGQAALGNNPPGNFNTAMGTIALLNTTGSENTACGRAALPTNTTGSGNTAVGSGALFSSTGNGNTALGDGAGGSVTTANNVICIGASGANVDNSCFIGNIYFNVQPIVGTDPDSVTITSAGRLGRGNVSSRRYKHDIQPMEKASEALYALKPVSFRYNKEYDATQTLAFGLIAEEVAEVYPDLVGRNPKGEPESVRYEQINTMLLNEFLKEHRRGQEQQKEIDALKAELKEQRDLIQKVTARLETREPTALVTKNP